MNNNDREEALRELEKIKRLREASEEPSAKSSFSQVDNTNKSKPVSKSEVDLLLAEINPYWEKEQKLKDV